MHTGESTSYFFTASNDEETEIPYVVRDIYSSDADETPLALTLGEFSPLEFSLQYMKAQHDAENNNARDVISLTYEVIYTYVYTYMHADACVHTSTCIHAYIHMYTHIHTHTFIHTHAYT